MGVNDRDVLFVGVFPVCDRALSSIDPFRLRGDAIRTLTLRQHTTWLAAGTPGFAHSLTVRSVGRSVRR